MSRSSRISGNLRGEREVAAHAWRPIVPHGRVDDERVGRVSNASPPPPFAPKHSLPSRSAERERGGRVHPRKSAVVDLLALRPRRTQREKAHDRFSQASTCTVNTPPLAPEQIR